MSAPIIFEKLVCGIIAEEMDLGPNQVYLWDQKIDEPENSAMYVVVSVMSCKPFGNKTTYDGSGSGLNQIQTINMGSTLSIDIMSRSTEARDRKEEVLMALSSVYSEQQQEAYSFNIANLSNNFVNLSKIDGAGIMYRFNISVRIQYFKTKTSPVPYYDTFASPTFLVDN